jgi:hypothetical protein
MNRLNKLLSTILALTLIASFAISSAHASDTYPLMAGQHIEVGSVTVSDDGINLTVEYNIDVDGWYILKTHMYADVKKPKKGAPGRFPFHSGAIHDTSFTFTVPLEDLGVASGDELYVAAHAEVNNESNIIGYLDEATDATFAEQAYETVCPTLGDIAAALPEYTRMNIDPDGAGYYDVRIDLNGDGAYATDGSETFDWYCIDKTHNIGLGDYTVRVFSSYEALPQEIINNGTGDNNLDSPENMDLVNWVMNNPGNPVTITQKQQQDVIWALVDDAKTRANLDTAEKQVYDAAVANGEGFVPAEGQSLAIVLQPVDASDNSVGQVTIGQVTIGQVTFGSLGLQECTEVPLYTPIFQSGTGETGWAIASGGTDFKGGWGSYFTYPAED